MGLVAAAGVAAATMLATAAPAQAAGTQSYQNRQTQYYLQYSGQGVNVTKTKDSLWTPVSAGGGAYRQIKAGGGDYCLDSNASKNVYLTRCDPNNQYQQWSIQKNGSFIMFKSRATGLCLDAAYSTAYTNPCSPGNFYQNWF